MSRIHPWSEFIKANIPLTRNLISDAQEHEKLRKELVGETLSILYLMAAKKIIRPESYPIVTVAKARFQYNNSSNQNQAAHCIPRQVLINSKLPADILRTGRSER